MMGALIDLTVKSTALLVGGAVIVLIMRRASAASRHQIWVGVLCAVALLPIARLGLPALNVAVLAAPAPEPTAISVSVPALAAPGGSPILFERIEEPATSAAASPIPALPKVSMAEAVVAIWLLVMAALAVRAAAAQLALRRLTAEATPVIDAPVLAVLQEAADRFRVRRRIALLSHTDDGLPCTFGVFHPVVLLPASLLSGDSEADGRLRAVLLHETAHIARLDAISARITQVAVMLFWFNPMIWLASRQARFERERAADDAVLAGGAKASDYASDLLAIARTQSTAAWSSAVPMAVSSLERRVRAILDERIRRGSHSRLSLAITLIVLAAMLPVSAVRLVARSTPASTNTTVEIPQAVALDYVVVQSPGPDRPSTPSRPMSLPLWDAHQSSSRPELIPGNPPTQPLPMAVASYTIGRDDVLVVSVWRQKDFSGEVVVRPDGKVTLPGVADDIVAAGLTLDAFKVKVIEQLKKYIGQPDVSIQVKEMRSADTLAAWNAERLTNLRQVLERARAAHRAALTRMQIGTTNESVAPQLAAAKKELTDMLTVRNVKPEHPDVKAMQATVKRLEAEAIAEPFSPVLLEAMVAGLEQTVKAFTPSAALPASKDIDAIRAAFATAVRNLEAAEIRFEHGLIRTSDLANALISAAMALGVELNPTILPGVDGRGRSFFFFNNETAAPVRAMFSEANFPGSTDKDRTSAKALYDLLTGRVQSINGFVYITGEVRTPGKYPLAEPMSVLQLLTLAGGLLPSADKNQIVVVSGTATDTDGKPLTRSINYSDLMKGKNLKENNVELGAGDAVIVRSPGPGYYWQR